MLGEAPSRRCSPRRGSPLGLAHYFVGCEVKGSERWKALALGRHTLADELPRRAADGDRLCWMGGRPLTPRPQERTAFAARRSKRGSYTTQHILEIALGALPFFKVDLPLAGYRS